MPFADLQSPRSQEFLNPTDPGDEEALFLQGFTDLAYKALTKAAPMLRADVVTFREHELDVNTGEAAGSFLVRYGTEYLHIPVILVDNAIKPLDVFYTRSLDRFYPLTSQWLDRVDRDGVNPMGRAVDHPKNVPTDIDLRNLVVPPQMGRFSFGEEQAKLAFIQVRREIGGRRTGFLDCVRAAPDVMKVAMAEGLQRKPEALRAMVGQYGVSALQDAFAPAPKTASLSGEGERIKRDVALYTASMPVQELQRELGPNEAAHAYSNIRKYGFYLKDSRESHKALLATGAERIALTSPTETGIYRVFMANGDARLAAVIVNPVRSDQYLTTSNNYRRPGEMREPPRLLVLFQDGSYAEPETLLAEALPATQGEFESFFLGRAQARPSEANKEGIIGHFYAMGSTFTDRIHPRDIRDNGKFTTFRDGGHTVTRVSGNLGGVKHTPNGILYGEDSFWWPLAEYISQSEVLSDGAVISALLEAKLVKEGAERVHVKRASDHGYIVANREHLYGAEALVKVAAVYGLSLSDAADALQAADSHLPAKLWAKTAGPETAPPMDPNMAGAPMDPSMMAPPAPPPPTGMDLAITEKVQLIQQQIAALQQQAGMLQEVQMRAQSIDGSGGMLAAPQAALGVMGAPPAMVGGAQAIAPIPQPGSPTGMEQPGQPGMMPQGQPGMMQPGMMPQGQPGMMPQGQPGMMPPGMAPQGPLPQPVMSQPPTPETIAGMIDPRFLNDAALMGDPHIFDAAAVASLVKPRALREIFRNFAPTLDAALDKMGRTLLLIYTQARSLRDQMGDEAYQRLEQRVRDTFRILGDTLILLDEHNTYISDGSIS